MSPSANSFTVLRDLAQRLTQVISFALILGLALALLTASLLAAFGILPWPDLMLQYGETSYQVGPALQIGLTVLALGFCAYLPANARIMALETSHRRFRISMQDVIRAYHAAHAADRSGAFTMSEQYDAVRERILYMRDHPDLAQLETDILETAAQMSTASHELAEIYSDDNMARARGFLEQRQTECDALEARIAEANRKSIELRQWVSAVEMDESIAQAQLNRLRDELSDLLPELDEEPGIDPRLNGFAANRLPAE
ncbi:DNA repair protein [Pseudooceanicola algae]|uniref:DNA repair protein n=1 Tax=Pseudooceanicola algae TaxID=1537215 RepID=A0A418SF23_9RHOB|nr:DNA repair protein [Pseudooceanicola algae]QPM89313.1 hypothetical protein PSAL_005280 [Pseudooceanicola algae]